MDAIVGFDVRRLQGLAQITLAMALGAVLIAHYNRPEYANGVRSDALRIVSAVITGVSFLGAGTIIRRTDKQDVEGLTTAASLLMTAAIGAAIALAQTALGIGTTVLALVVLRTLRRLDAVLRGK